MNEVGGYPRVEWLWCRGLSVRFLDDGKMCEGVLMVNVVF